MHGWRWDHAKRAVVPQKGTQGRWMTPTTKGRPDILALRDGFQLVAELKIVGQYPKPAQREWLEDFHLVPGVLVWVSRPSDDWPQLEGWLRHPENAPTVFGWEPAVDKATRLASKRQGS